MEVLGSNMDGTGDEEETVRRRDAALLRALSTPHKRQSEMKIGKRKRQLPVGTSKKFLLPRNNDG
jgi:hypothetical protein